MTVVIPLKEKYRSGPARKQTRPQNHSGTVARRRRSVDWRKRTGSGRDWYR